MTNRLHVRMHAFDGSHFHTCLILYVAKGPPCLVLIFKEVGVTEIKTMQSCQDSILGVKLCTICDNEI